MNIEKILLKEGEKLETRHKKANLKFPIIISVPEEEANGMFKYKIGETITFAKKNFEFTYCSKTDGYYDFEYKLKNEAIQ